MKMLKKVKYHIKDISKDDCSEYFNDVSFCFPSRLPVAGFSLLSEVLRVALE